MVNIYNNFHKDNKAISKIIKTNDFTYINTIDFLKVTNILNTNHNILDIGCGSGTIDYFIAEKGCKIDAIDISDIAINRNIANAEILGLSNYVKFYVSNFPDELLPKINNSKYDTVLLLEVLEHLEEDKKSLDKIYFFLKQNGYLILSVPLFTAPLYKLGCLYDFDKRVGHLRRYSKKGIFELLDKTGFRIIANNAYEGIFRNLLFTSKNTSFVISGINHTIPIIFNALDKLSVKLFGASNLIIFAQKK